MDVQDIIALSRAGFSATQIAEMMKQDAKQEQKPEQKQEQKQEPTQEQKQEPKQEPTQVTFDKIYEEINKLRRTVEESNIKSSIQPETVSVDDILKNFINDKE